MILSIQSHVCYGYVGNRVATFILQRLGFDVITLNTVQFSNHTGYGHFVGDILEPTSLEKIINHLDERGKLQNCQALLTGYLGAPETADFVLKTKKVLQKNLECLYACDPVMGDVGRGFFVKEEIPEKFKTVVVPQANIISPNLFELEVLSGQKVTTIEELKNAVITVGCPITIVTSVFLRELDAKKIYMLLYYGGQFFLAGAPCFSMTIAPNGAGDAVSALFLGYFLRNNDPKKAFLQTNTAMHAIFKKTFDLSQRELALIQSQDLWSRGEILFEEEIIK